MPRARKDTTVPEDPELLAREARALAMRGSGDDLATIAQALDYAGPSGAWKAIQRALKRYPAAAADEYRQLQNSQLDELERETWSIFHQALAEGELELALKAQDRIQKWLDRRAKLNGIDAPIKSEVDHKGGTFSISVPSNRLPAKAQEQLAREAEAEQEAEQ